MRVEAPPQRYRVVERDRRLEVIDTWGEHGIRPPIPSRPASADRRNPGLRQTAFDGTAMLTTRRWYDLKGPRTVTLDPGTAGLVARVRLVATVLAVGFALLAIWMPALLVLLALLFQPKMWKRVRERVTAWLDRFEPA